MLKPQGYLVIVDPNAPTVEADTATCGHCQKIVIMRATPDVPKPDTGGMCRLCWRLVCGPCADKGECEPFEKKLEMMEKRDIQRRRMGI